MVGHDAVDDLVAFVELLGQLRADGHVSAFHFVVDGLADVMQKTGALGQGHIAAQFGGHDPRQMGNLDGMVQHVLAIAGAVAHAAQQLDQLMMDAVHVGLEDRLLAGLADLVVDLAAGLLDHFLDARGMDAPVSDQLFQRDARNLAADRVKRGDDHGLGRVVDDQVDARRRLQRADIAALAADDAALHVLIGQGDHGDRRLRDMVGGAALNRHRDDVARLLLGLVLGVLLDLAHEHTRVVIRLLLDALHDHILGLFLGHLRDALQLHAALLVKLLRGLLSRLGRGLLARGELLSLLRQAVELVLLALQGRFACVEVVRLFVEGLLALSDAALAALHLGATVANLAVELILQADNLFLRLKDALLLLLLRTALGVVQQVARVFLRAPDFLFLNVFAIHIAARSANGQRSDSNQT